MATSQRYLGRSQGQVNEHRHTVNLRSITLRSNLCQHLPCHAKAHANRCELPAHHCLKQAEPWTVCLLRILWVCARVCVCVHTPVCLLAFVSWCWQFFIGRARLATHRECVNDARTRTHIHRPKYTYVQRSAQSPVGRRPRARPHIWQESNWACLMVNIQERRWGEPTCRDEGERRAISSESRLAPSHDPAFCACACVSAWFLSWLTQHHSLKRKKKKSQTSKFFPGSSSIFSQFFCLFLKVRF